ncbi:ribonuclease P/MRP protein subunit RPP1 [Nematocida minor]|uniref:ribonuclease P/MRP protein subunit RPP1 n=1 Tax=Nematocida minor TaxID=1912983 RepID=UPI002221105B|nr:ribonuclease P/MRP protein subunit RPP1 [Nematocida minor]KAI5189885.1 ribonuclease P/MRP protein subunit RPP1 [Nematocida minor]
MYTDVHYSAERTEGPESRFIYTYKTHVKDKTEAGNRGKGISKIVIHGITQQTRTKEVYDISEKYDICELFIDSIDSLFRCAQWQIHSIQLDMTKEAPIFNKGAISTGFHASLYFNVNMEGYLRPQTRRAWIYNVKELLRLCSKKYIIVSFGETVMEEQEVLEIFAKFKIKKSVATKFYTTNIENMLIQAATKKFAFKGVITPMQEQESSFKKMIYKATKPVANIK